MTPFIFIDFDGTIVPYDVEFEIFKKFGGDNKAADVVARWERREIDSPQRLTQGFESLRDAGVKKSQLDAFLKEVPLDPAFSPFMQFINDHKWENAILSDGLVWYIEGILKNHNLDIPPIISNEIDFDNNWRLSFPHHNGDCSSCRQCGTCKRYPVREAKAHADTVILITDGRADRWAAIECDVVFAKEPLLSTLQLWKKPRKVFAFENFDDVKRELLRL